MIKCPSHILNTFIEMFITYPHPIDIRKLVMEIKIYSASPLFASVQCTTQVGILSS